MFLFFLVLLTNTLDDVSSVLWSRALSQSSSLSAPIPACCATRTFTRCLSRIVTLPPPAPCWEISPCLPSSIQETAAWFSIGVPNPRTWTRTLQCLEEIPPSPTVSSIIKTRCALSCVTSLLFSLLCLPVFSFMPASAPPAPPSYFSLTLVDNYKRFATKAK